MFAARSPFSSIARALSLRALLAAAAFALPLPALAAPPEDARTILQRARGQQALTNYEEAVTNYEAFAQAYPADAEAPSALKEALVIRIALGQLDLATRDAELFHRNYGVKQPGEAATVLVGLAAAHVERDDFATGKKLLDSGMAFIDRAAPLDKRILAHTLLGRAWLKLGDSKRAEDEFTKVRALWKDPAAALKTLESQGADNRRIAQALTSVGEAHFFFAEQKRVLADSIAFPAYTGRGDRDDVHKHLNTKVVDWVKRKRPAIELAEKEYLRIVEIQPAAPPRWVIAAASRVGQMWAHFVSDFRAAPLPKEWMKNGPVPGSSMTYEELRKTYYQAIDEAAEPQKRAARGAFRTCLSYAVKFQYFDAHAQTCVDWLTRFDRAAFPRIDELAPRWGLIAAPGLSAEPLPEAK